MNKDLEPGLPSLKERGMRSEVKDRFVLFFALGIAIGTAVGIVIKNIPAATSMGMIIGLIRDYTQKLFRKTKTTL